MLEKNISFVLPAFNEEKYIASSLESILAQDYPSSCIEVIVVDNGSTDQTIDIAQSYPVTVIQASREDSIAKLRNIGVKKAKGEYLVFVDTDSTLAADWLKKAIAFFDDPQVAIVGQYTYALPEDTWVARTVSFRDFQSKEVEEKTWLPTRSIMVRRNVYEEVGGFNEGLTTAEDVDFGYRITELSYKILRPKELVGFHLGEDKTLQEHFAKEVWRGRSTLRRILYHELVKGELLSVFLPCYYLALFLSFGFLPYFAGRLAVVFLLLAICLLSPALLYSFLKCKKNKNFRYYFPLTLVFLVYASARSLSFILELSDLVKQLWLKKLR